MPTAPGCPGAIAGGPRQPPPSSRESLGEEQRPQHEEGCLNLALVDGFMIINVRDEIKSNGDMEPKGGGDTEDDDLYQNAYFVNTRANRLVDPPPPQKNHTYSLIWARTDRARRGQAFAAEVVFSRFLVARTSE